MLTLLVLHSAPVYRHGRNRRIARGKIRDAILRTLIRAQVFLDEESARSCTRVQFARGATTSVHVRQIEAIAGYGWIGDKANGEEIAGGVVDSVNACMRKAITEESFGFRLTAPVVRSSTDRLGTRPWPTRRSRSRQGAGAMAR